MGRFQEGNRVCDVDASPLSITANGRRHVGLSLHLQTKQTQMFRLGQVVHLLQMSADELDEHLAESARDNPMLILRPRPPSALSATDVLEMTAVEEVRGLYDHLSRQLAGLIAEGGLMERLVTALMENLDPSGWLARTPEEIAKEMGVTTELVETALRVVQNRVEPTGLFARDLQDCLRLQLEDRGAMSGSMAIILAHLRELEQGGLSGLVARTGLDVDEVEACLSVIRRLDPKPGSRFADDPTLLRQPDVRVTASDDGWTIEFLSSLQEEIEIAPVPRSHRSAATAEALTKARSLKHALDVRRAALKQVVGAIVERQGAFFRHGTRALRPMTMSQIATETGVHCSTVSRVLNGLLIEGPNGIIAARCLFGGTVSARSDHSKPQVQARIRALLATEDPQNPISDRRLTVLLHGEGIAVSRRVVSNYRQDIGIQAAAKRRAVV